MFNLILYLLLYLCLCLILFFIYYYTYVYVYIYIYIHITYHFVTIYLFYPQTKLIRYWNNMFNLLIRNVMVLYAIRKRIKKDGKLIESYRLVSFGLYTTYNEAKRALDMFINIFEFSEFEYSKFINGYIPKIDTFDNYRICYDIFGEIII